MYDISEYLNIMGNFACDLKNSKVSLLGSLERKPPGENGFILRARIPISDKCIIEANSFNLYGKINNQELSFLNCYVIKSSHTYTDGYINAALALDIIVIGEHYNGIESIQQISVELPVLNFFFMYKISPFSDGNYREDYVSANPALTSSTQFGCVSIEPSITFSSSLDQFVMKFIPHVRYSFKNSKTLDSALEHMFSIRNLLMFFADGYIDLRSFEYTTNLNTATGMNSNEISVILNQVDVIPEVDEPFLLMRSSVANDFQSIVSRWLDFYQNGIYVPSLFFETVTYRSKGINGFLNLIQAVEIYSSSFRNNEAKYICNNDPEAKEKDKPSLKHRLVDIFSYLKDILNISNNDIDGIARNISNNRNFYTHYSKKRKEPSDQTVSSMILLLRFTVIALVYRHIGVDDQTIQLCKSFRFYKTMDTSIQNIISNEHRNKTILE